MNPLDAVNQLGHAESLGRLEDLPADYVQAINDLSVAPLWPDSVSMAGLPAWRAWVRVGPPLSARGPRRGSASRFPVPVQPPWMSQ